MGRPQRRNRDERRQQIIDVARDLFSENGYESTSLDAILSRTGGSRRDIYDFFQDKQGLYDAVMRSLITEVLSATSIPAEQNFKSDIRAELEEIGQSYLGHMLDPVFVASARQFISVASERKELGEAAYQAGPAVLYERFANYLDKRVSRGDFLIEDTNAAAKMFIEMLKGEYQVRALMTGSSGMTPERMETHVEQVVKIFLYGVSRSR
ncbi:TetR/AcrR family transcriptional regulator [Labrenzia sp. CE80]|uniref:TetR/AcrR family transcriptional regulator n=1 Tax=Labrenzia sp. CE80 TaxID=1788986 RepID=UPI00129AF4B5|nr:TetR/AcrR family transcriptional regulator [Labrenzia sp. CE80]